ncbi:MAG TPA: hypothetical protein ENN40_01260 [Candidatus Aminicenantes bacterium]|nr:hypothetical protein [Candidatus Aminicenantes bacterium]
MKMALLIVVLVAFSMVFIACGNEKKTEASTPIPADQTAVKPETVGEGILLAKEILGVFDEIVARVNELSKKKPEAEVLKSRLENLFVEYKAKMEGYNVKDLALKADVRQWRACNRYLGENRGGHVFQKDTVLTEVLKHYNLQVGDREIVNVIGKTPVKLLDIAVQQMEEK